MRPASAGIRFYSREEDICDFKPFDWGDGDKGGELSATRSGSTAKLPRPRPISAPPVASSFSSSSSSSSSFRHGTTRIPSLVFESKNGGKIEEDSRLLDDLTRGYKGLETRDQLAQYPTPRLDLYVQPRLESCGAASRPATAGEIEPAIRERVDCVNVVGSGG